ncbi:hypothetical protein AB0L40_26065 [Patulibacter sp. NPDC049589]|uniref:hypothetical protein n=1 Tax=Patulibacter sp. NPDC049589 TaxID=3154731 RepID=UPI003425E8B4
MTDDQCLALAKVAERPRRHDRLVSDLADDLAGSDATDRGLDALAWLEAHGLASAPPTDLSVWQLTGGGRALLGQVQSRVGGQ